MRIGKDAVTFTIRDGIKTVGYLSQTFLNAINASEVFVPMASWNEEWALFDSSSTNTDQSLKSLEIIEKYSILRTDEDLIDQFSKLGDKGTRILIHNLKGWDDGVVEFLFKGDDIILKEEYEMYMDEKRSGTAEDEYSLRAYLSILYLEPRMKIMINGRKVLPKRMSFCLYNTRKTIYKPKRKKEEVDKKKICSKVEAMFLFGFNKEARDQFGMMYYHNNRLIRRWHRIGMQNSAGSRGRGVIGLIDASFLTPTHNKQDFVYGNDYRVLQHTVNLRLKSYWQCCKIDKGSGGMTVTVWFENMNKSKDRGPYWIQCDSCLKWRQVPHKPNSYPSNWECKDNPSRKFARCSTLEERPPDFLSIPKGPGKADDDDDDDDMDEDSEEVRPKPIKRHRTTPTKSSTRNTTATKNKRRAGTSTKSLPKREKIESSASDDDISSPSYMSSSEDSSVVVSDLDQSDSEVYGDDDDNPKNSKSPNSLSKVATAPKSLPPPSSKSYKISTKPKMKSNSSPSTTSSTTKTTVKMTNADTTRGGSKRTSHPTKEKQPYKKLKDVLESKSTGTHSLGNHSTKGIQGVGTVALERSEEMQKLARKMKYICSRLCGNDCQIQLPEGVVGWLQFDEISFAKQFLDKRQVETSPYLLSFPDVEVVDAEANGVVEGVTKEVGNVTEDVVNGVGVEEQEEIVEVLDAYVKHESKEDEESFSQEINFFASST
eukprot:TRINITY_DN4558_c0_g1_i3.p1 TRINITY_DN4558_c0_g1~~TRINITY_DN4558_c0_g1_i3.p1  ORF type:complete len:712 (-),score=181.60 TRINITY_DN4558_c0_g1_i3:1829-3964(-)